MAFKIIWKPVLQALALKDYHPDYGENVIMVCVNPQPELLQERSALLQEYAEQFAQVQAAQSARKTSDAVELSQKFSNWTEQVFVPKANDWFARLWSFGDEKFTEADLRQYGEIDPHFLTWLKNRSIEMIEEHRQGRKKA